MHHCLDQSHLTDILLNVDIEQGTKHRIGEKLCCGACGAVITDESNSMEVDSRHEHYKVNPQGKSFHIRCFKNATGCTRFGEPTAEFSWFTGYAWRFAHCSHCGVQLGWYFTGPDPFYGLIKQLLVVCDKSVEH